MDFKKSSFPKLTLKGENWTKNDLKKSIRFAGGNQTVQSHQNSSSTMVPWGSDPWQLLHRKWWGLICDMRRLTKINRRSNLSKKLWINVKQIHFKRLPTWNLQYNPKLPYLKGEKFAKPFFEYMYLRYLYLFSGVQCFWVRGFRTTWDTSKKKTDCYVWWHQDRNLNPPGPIVESCVVITPTWTDCFLRPPKKDVTMVVKWTSSKGKFKPFGISKNYHCWWLKSQTTTWDSAKTL